VSIAQRRAYALAHPLNGPYDSTAPYTDLRAHARGFLLLSILAVDR
jgi:hypothetical protein